MIVQQSPPLHLTYCLNVHPGESLSEVLGAVREFSLAVRDAIAPGQPFGLGLRLSGQAARELEATAARDELKQLLADENLYVFTLNGFPYGAFHGTTVKESVYRPDWRTEERLAYTCRLADILADLLPAGQSGSISTLPCSYKPWMESDRDVEHVVERLADCVFHLAQLEKRTGKELHVGLEPEPGCFLETTDEAVTFFKKHVVPRGCHRLEARHDVRPSEAEHLLRRHLGVCLDACHAAVQFEEPLEAMRRIQEAGIRLSKVQLSAAVETVSGADQPAELKAFDEPVYLHQTRMLHEDGSLSAWPDLGIALAELAGRRSCAPLRVHFHVPLFWRGSGGLRSTGDLLGPPFFDALRRGPVEHLEIETYTLDVLPAAFRDEGVAGSLVREYRWAMDRLTG